MCGLNLELNCPGLNQIESSRIEIGSIVANLDGKRNRRGDGGSQVVTEERKQQQSFKKKMGKGKEESQCWCVAAQPGTGLIITLGLLSSPMHCIVSV